MKSVPPGPRKGQQSESKVRLVAPSPAPCGGGGGSDPPPSGRRRRSPVSPDLLRVLAERQLLRAVLRRSGVAPEDLDDAVQQCVVAAWEAGRAGRYCPDPARAPDDALRIWLSAVAVRTASRFRDKAYRRREVPTAVVPEASALPRVDIQVYLSESVRALSELRRELWEVLVLVGLGWVMAEIAEVLGIPEGTVATRLRLGRRALGRALRLRRALRAGGGEPRGA
jgi:DNA-directed RNA polymerase specialized sigma24 family protein